MKILTRLIGQLVLTILICSISKPSNIQGYFLNISIHESHAQSTQEDELFRALILRATQAFKRKEYLQAIDSFKRALLLRKSEYNIHWNLAVLYQKVGILEEALSHVNQFLDKERAPKRKEKAEQRRNKILKAMKDAYFSPVKKAPLATPSAASPSKPKTPPPQKTEPRVPPTPQKKSTDPSTDTSGKQPSVVARTSPTHSRDRSWIVWSVSGLSFALIGASLHLYANTVWQGRPQGGMRTVLDAQETAETSSMVGDSFLVVGVGAMLYGLYKMLSQGADRGRGEATPGLGGQPPEGWSRRSRRPLKRSTSISILPASGGGSISLEYVF